MALTRWRLFVLLALALLAGVCAAGFTWHLTHALRVPTHSTKSDAWSPVMF
ncbi:MAG TPA: hypothetical protein VGG70_12240 [Candidatus Cybelea sp.]